MPDKRHHRGAHPEDADSFAQAWWPALRLAVAELSWLLTRGYAEPSALKLVGDRHNLTVRQRTAVMRCSCSDEALLGRAAREADVSSIAGQALHIDGYNVLTTIETALAGAVVLIGRDTCWRDMASMHGSFRKVDETRPALELAGKTLTALGAGPCMWFLDEPVSNSGRLATIMRELAEARGWDWQVSIVPSPDYVLIHGSELVVTADSVVLDRCGRWMNLARRIVTDHISDLNLVDLSTPEALDAVQCPAR